MNSIKELNEKIWYRFIKVIYIIIFIMITFIINIFSSILIYEIKIHGNKYEIKNHINEDMIQKFIERWKSQWRSRDEIKVAYDKALADWIFNEQLEEKNELLIIKWILIWILLIILEIIISYLIFFKIINKIFYYIILWKLIPKE